MDLIIKTVNLFKKYPVGKKQFIALNNINFEIQMGEFLGIVGPSGSGKTSLLNILGSLDVPSEGTATVLGNDISKLTHQESSSLRKNHIGFIFQTFNLLPVYTVYENVEFPLLLLKISESERKKRVMEALDWVKLTDKKDSKPMQLSGGQAQRVAIARAVVKKPALILADEPTANLDVENSHNILEILENLNQMLKTTFVFSTHDEKVIQYIKRKITVVDGKIANDEQGLGNSRQKKRD